MAWLEICVLDRREVTEDEQLPGYLRKQVPEGIVLLEGDTVFIPDDQMLSLDIQGRDFDSETGHLTYYLGSIELDDDDVWYGNLIEHGWVASAEGWPD